MKNLIAATVAIAAFASVAGSAAAAVSDVEYLRANRCRGLAEGGLTQVDTAGMDAFLKAEGRTRNAYVAERGKAEFDKAKREAKTDSTEKKAKLTAELSGPCQAYKS